MKIFSNLAFKIISAALLCLSLAGSANARGNKINWEVLVDASQPITFFSNSGNGISTDLFGPFIPGSTYWVKGNLYPAGSVNKTNFTVDPSKKIGEWYCTGTRLRDIFAQPSPAQGSLYEEAYFTFRLNSGNVVYTKHQAFFKSDVNTNVLYSNVSGIKAGDIITIKASDLFQSPPYILVTNIQVK